MTANPSASQLSVLVLGALLLLRRDDRLLLAPLYGGGLLVVIELSRASIELRDVELVATGAIRGRLLVVTLLTSVGIGVAAIAAAVAAGGPARTVASTAAGAIAIAILFGAIVRSTRSD